MSVPWVAYKETLEAITDITIGYGDCTDVDSLQRMISDIRALAHDGLKGSPPKYLAEPTPSRPFKGR